MKTDKHYFFRAHVWPSMRSELPHNVLVILSVARGAVNHDWYMYDGMREYRS